MSKNNNNQATVSTMKQLKEVAGLFSCLLEHKVVKTTAQTKWTGPPFPQEEWHKVLSFFQWTHDTHKCESQVRIYYNSVESRWAFWAYPQMITAGLASNELEEHPDHGRQRLQFNKDDGWMYFGTVHHHCNASAFQSGHDLNNEHNQDGLHITIGGMGDKRYTMHERLYLMTGGSSQLINHDLSWFWDIGDSVNELPPWVRKVLPSNIEDQLARGAMCEKAPDGTEFPDQWKDNLVKKPEPVVISTGQAYQGGLGYSMSKPYQRNYSNTHFDLRTASGQLTELCKELKIDEIDAINEMLTVLEGDQFWVKIIALMYRNDVSLEAFAQFLAEDLAQPPAATDKLQLKDSFPDYQEGGEHWGHHIGE